jgi:hypothetical protein
MKQRNQNKIALTVARSNLFESKVLEYLSNHPSGRSASELAMEAITNYWLEEAVGEQISEPHFYKACYIAAQILRAQANFIEQRMGITSTAAPIAQPESELSTREITPVKEVQKDNSKIEESEDDDWEDGEFVLKPTAEMAFFQKQLMGN